MAFISLKLDSWENRHFERLRLRKMSQHNTQVDVFNLKYQKIGLDCILLTVKWLCHCSVPASGFFLSGGGLVGFCWWQFWLSTCICVYSANQEFAWRARLWCSVSLRSSETSIYKPQSVLCKEQFFFLLFLLHEHS